MIPGAAKEVLGAIDGCLVIAFADGSQVAKTQMAIGSGLKPVFSVEPGPGGLRLVWTDSNKTIHRKPLTGATVT